MTTEINHADVALLNDVLRKFTMGGDVTVSDGIKALGIEFTLSVMEAVRSYTGFTPDNDPYGEHDSGVIEVMGRRVMFKIACYDLRYQYASANPADPHVTNRVLIMMLADEH